MIFRDHTLWPCYVRPLDDELFSSWYMRICGAHLTKSHSFSKYFFENTPIWNRDIDQMPKKIIEQKLLKHTTLEIEQVRSLFLSSYEGILFECYSNSNPIINNIGVYHRIRKRYGLLYCPGCFDSGELYYKKKWRLKTSVACTSCGLRLRERCINCGSPICFHRLENGYKNSHLKDSMSKCYNCLRDLRSGKVFAIAEPDELDFQNYIDLTISNGYNEHCTYSFQYFEFLITMQRCILTNSKLWSRIKDGVVKQYSKEFSVPKFHPVTLEQNRESLLIVHDLLRSWPENFSGFCKANNIRYSDMTKDMSDPPFFLYDLFRKIY